MNTKKIVPEDTMEILIVEDSPTQAEQLKYLLEKHGYKVSVANNGKQALSLFNERKPALVISDIVMPEMNGYGLCKQIKSDVNAEEVPVILLTSLADAEDVLEGLACGADNFITKPYNEDYLISSIQQIIANKKLRSGERIRIGVEIVFAGKKRFITAEQQQMLSLLLSSYEAAVQKNKELAQTQDKLRYLNEHLEDMVKERTAKLMNEVTERNRVEENLRQSEEKFSKAFQTSPYAITITRAEDGKFIDINETFTSMTGYSREEALAGTSVGMKVWVNEEDRQGVVADLRAGRAVKGHECRFRTKAGKIIMGLFSAQIIPLSHGPCILSSINDITDRKRAEEKIKSQLLELQRWQDVMLGREDRVQELKREVNGLNHRHGEPLRYPSQEAGPTDSHAERIVS